MAGVHTEIPMSRIESFLIQLRSRARENHPLDLELLEILEKHIINEQCGTDAVSNAFADIRALAERRASHG